MLMSRVKIKSIISKKNIYNTLTTRDGDGEVAVSLPNLSVLVNVTAQCSFMNPSQRLLVVAAGGWWPDVRLGPAERSWWRVPIR